VSQREGILAAVESVPSLPAAATEVAQLLQDPDVSLDELMRAIEYDPGLTSNVLRLANSAYFGFAGAIDSVRQAIIRLGTRTIYHLVVASSVAPMATRPVQGYDLPSGGLWKHSVSVAVGMQELAKMLGTRLPGYAFSAGILHDVGKLVLGTYLEIDASPIVSLAYEQHLSFEVAERRILGIDHAEVSAVLLDSWGLPSSIVDVSRWHHQPDHLLGDKLVVDLIHVADNLSIMSGVGTGIDGLNYSPSSDVLERLGLTEDMIERALCQMLSGMEELRGLFTSRQQPALSGTDGA
jgi:putative nucleotidyltransferase with HDIG domain